MTRMSILTLFVLLAACIDGPQGNGSQEPANAAPIAFSAVNEVVAGTFFAAIDPEFGYVAIQNAAKDLCGSESICKVVIFKTGTVLPEAFPMTEREVKEAIGNYTLNRNSGLDELIATCPSVADTPKDKCAAAVGP